MRTSEDSSDLAGKKIVILIGVFMRGGCERQAFLLARDLRLRYGLDAQVWALTCDGAYRSAFEAAGIPTRVLNFGKPRFGWVQRCRPVVTLLREERVDILLPFTTWPNVVAGLCYRFAGVGLCIWGERHAGGERVPLVERIAVKQYRRFVANSTAGIEFLASEMHVSRDRISFVPNGVEDPEISGGSDWRARLALSPEQLLVVKVANVTNFKDHATLLRAWKIVQDEWTDGDRPVLALAGYLADTYAECEKIVREGGLQSTVRFLGGVADVPNLLNASDLTAFSSRNEGMPNGVLECMAAGKGVVASDLPGVRDALGPNMAGTLIPQGDANRFARVLLELLRDKAKRAELGTANRARIRSEFSVERMVERHVQIVRESLSEARFGLWSRSMAATGAERTAAE